MLPMPKDNSLFIPLETENFLFLVQRVFFGFSVCLHIPALFCLIKETPAHQAQIKPNLILVQIAVIVIDLFDTIFFEIVPIAEAFLGYCKGLLCRVLQPTVVSNKTSTIEEQACVYASLVLQDDDAKFFSHFAEQKIKAAGGTRVLVAKGIITCVGLYVYTITALGAATLTCILARHQALMPEESRWKLGQNIRRAILIGLPIPFFLPPTVFVVSPFSAEESERLLNESRYDLYWVRERGPYFKLPENTILHVTAWASIFNLFGVIVVTMSPFVHMFYVLNQEAGKSDRTKQLVRRSLQRLFVQLNVPLLFLVVPLIIFFVQMETRIFPFMFPVITMFTVCLHPICHNLVLLFVMPTYRKAIAKGLRKLSGMRASNVVKSPLNSVKSVKSVK
ncbi:hypothetical protein PRIPAC_82787 [Pristionchus pacificus]|uniref:G protein-coupled receptor n=1 Tax=Pristionchus pacificus TaxID=54126 RepID=A0A2A6BVQ9_PRIPA|nr:hypothetical protein PRIPAC_82787 [Pristionchus pacificus]|eukprot:PDM69863.1 G protein-coupled receptor [Pristionchus pacificus]